MGDGARLRQVLLNLVGNSVKFTSKGHVKLSFKVADAGQGDLAHEVDGRVRLRFEVSDTGIGIPHDKLGDIFDVFTQADSSTTRRWPQIGASVLVVEDNLVNQLVVHRLLQRLGCRVDLVGDGRECIDRLAERKYDVVLMDCQMPVMDGFEATRAIRASEGGNYRQPMIALTAHAMASDRERCEQAGMDDYLTKPIDLERLTAALSRYAAQD